MGDWLGRRVELDVTNIAHGGVSVSRLDGRVVFVADAIPGEKVIAEISEDSKSSFWRADAVEVLEPSAHRQDHVWPEAALDRAPKNRAGGAEFGHITLAYQRELKRQVLADALERMADIEWPVEVVAIGDDDETGGVGWRTRISLHVDESGRPGPYVARTHNVVRVARLPLATDEINAIAPLSQTFTPGTTLSLVSPSGRDARLIVGKQKPTVIAEQVGRREFALADTGFWQVHTHAAVTLSRAIQLAIDVDRFDPLAPNVDLYGGVGLLAAAVADQFGTETVITSVESDAAAAEFASRNLAEWAGAVAVHDRVERWLARTAAPDKSSQISRNSAATVVLDPPRSGAGANIVETLAVLGPAQIVYVACDPVAFARDARLLKLRGYTLSRLAAFDLFPHTHHVEAIGTFLRQ